MTAMTELLPYIIGGAVLYALANIMFGIWLGKRIARANPTEEPEDLLEWPPYEKHL
jgi:fructose-specific phosphotransferase system IIC component